MNPFAEPAVVIQAMPRWDGAYASTSFTIAKELSKDRLVFYVDHPFTWKDMLNKSAEAQLERRRALWNRQTYHEKPFKDLPNLVIISPKPVPSINFLPPGSVYNQCRAYNNRLVWNYINMTLDRFAVSEFVYLNSFDPVYSMVDTTKEVLLKIYHSVDYMPGERYIARHGVQAEELFAKQADIVIGTSEPITKRLRKWNRRAMTIENAADFSMFDEFKGEVPEDMASIPYPRVLYLGNIGLRMDYTMLEDIVSENEGVNFVFAGPENSREFKGEALKKYKNVYFLGRKDYEKVPAYIKGADLCIIPFIRNEYTRHIYPLKINEYLSMGKPVLVSNFADFSSFKDVVYLYESKEEFQEKMQEALTVDGEDKISERKAVAASNTWEKRMLTWRKLLREEVQIRVNR
ncbi:glycosyltransferase [Algivirga pacifica]|uniref:Uncharacterized protein n=1 Tax=Algivirga pacifica TaxID=1162670 RepID=A0ABP9DCX9_9BACT